MRATRGATSAWMLLAFEVFCVPRTPRTVLLLVKLNTSGDGTIRTRPT